MAISRQLNEFHLTFLFFFFEVEFVRLSLYEGISRRKLIFGAFWVSKNQKATHGYLLKFLIEVSYFLISPSPTLKLRSSLNIASIKENVWVVPQARL